MKTLLILLFGFNTIGPTVIYNNKPIVNKLNNIKNYKEKQNLIGTKVNDTISNLNWVTDSDTKEKIQEEVILDVISANEENDIATNALLDVISNPNNWDILGIKFEKPTLGTKEVYDAKFLAKTSNEKYSGFLKVSVTLENESTSNDLFKIFKNKYIGEFNNPSESEIRAKIKDSKPNLDWSQIDISDINYETALVKAKQGSETYFGEATVNYKVNLKNDFKWESKKVSVEVYNSENYKKDDKTFEYVPSLGIDNFNKKYKKISINWKGTSMYKNLSGNVVKYYPETITDVTMPSAKKFDFWSESYYGSVNWNYTNANVTIGIENNRVIIHFLVQVEASASWVNAYYSGANGQITINSINFI